MVVIHSIAYARPVMREKRGSAPKKKSTTAKKKAAAAPKKKAVAAKKKTAAVVPKKKTAAVAPKKKAAPAPKKKAKATKVAAVAPKKKVAAVAPKKAAAAAPKKKAAAAPKKKARAAPKKKAGAAREIPPPRPSDRAMEAASQLPSERPLTDEEREAMSKVAQTALAALEGDGAPDAIVTRIGCFVDEIRTGRRPEPNSQDVRLGLGVLWGEQVRAQVGWRWVHLSYPNGFASYALVPDDRAFACFPLNRLSELMTPGADGVNTCVPLFDSIRVGMLPARRENAYLVIG